MDNLSDIDVVNAYQDSMMGESTIDQYDQLAGRISGAMRTTFLQAILVHMHTTLGVIQNLYGNPFTQAQIVRGARAAFTHLPALNEHPARAFWKDAGDAIGATCSAIHASRTPEPSTLQQMPDLVSLRQTADGLSHDVSLHVSKAKVLFLMLTCLPAMIPVEIADLHIIPDSHHIRLWENALVLCADGSVDMVVQSRYHAPVVRKVTGDLAAAIHASVTCWPRRYLFADKHGAVPSPDTFSGWACRNLLSRTGRKWTMRGARNACATRYICLDPGPLQTPNHVLSDMAEQMSVSVAIMLVQVKDYGPQARTQNPAEPVMPWPAMIDCASELRGVVQDLHGAGTDLDAMLDCAKLMDDNTLQSSMSHVLLHILATSALPRWLYGLGTVHVTQSEEMLVGQNSHHLRINGDNATLSLTSGLDRLTLHLTDNTSRAVKRSLGAHPRELLFMDPISKAPLRGHTFHVWLGEVLDTAMNAPVTWYGVGLAHERRNQA